VISRASFAYLFTLVVALLASPAQGDVINSLVGVNFQPYIGAWSGNPLAPPLFNSYTYADVLADLQTVQARGFASIKTYGVGTSPFSGNGNNLDSNQYNVQAANALGLSVHLGANLQFANGGLDMVRTKMEIDLAIKQVATYPGTVKTLIIGNESIGVNGVTVADMVSLMDYAKTQRTASGFTAATLPVTTVQQWGVLAGAANQALSQAAEGSIYANIYPFFDANTSIDNAIAQFHTDYDALRAALNGFGLGNLPISIGETGWATAGTNPTNSLGTPNTVNALKYFNDYVAQVTVPTFFFEAFDEPWKANPQTNPQSVEPHFGLPRTGIVGSPPPVPPAPVPEPSSLLIAVLGLGTLAMTRFGMSRRRGGTDALSPGGGI
jgi:exo-beta-1,3-glucanase (GH17 family)